MHVVISGQARHVGCYRQLLHRVQAARRAGALETVTLVHWKGQADLVQDLARQFPEAADKILLLEEPVLRSPGHFFHQVYSLDHGLAGRADEDVVLRLRPDIYVDDQFLLNARKLMEGHERPLWSPFADLTCPFFACDMVIAGRAGALRDQANYSQEPYLISTPPGFPREPTRCYSHEAEVQRWLHPVRQLDWRTRAYWRHFPSFGFVSGYRSALMTQYRDWDFYQGLRTAWLEYLVGSIAIGGLHGLGRIGLVRVDGPTAERGQVQWLDALQTAPDLCSERTLDREIHEFIWTTQDSEVQSFLAFVRQSTGPERPITPAELQVELAAKWQTAIALRSQSARPGGMHMPYTNSTIIY